MASPPQPKKEDALSAAPDAAGAFEPAAAKALATASPETAVRRDAVSSVGQTAGVPLTRQLTQRHCRQQGSVDHDGKEGQGKDGGTLKAAVATAAVVAEIRVLHGSSTGAKATAEKAVG